MLLNNHPDPVIMPITCQCNHPWNKFFLKIHFYCEITRLTKSHIDSKVSLFSESVGGQRHYRHLEISHSHHCVVLFIKIFVQSRCELKRDLLHFLYLCNAIIS